MNKKFTENIKKGTNKLVGYGIWFLIVLLAISGIRSVANASRVKAQIKAEQDKVLKMRLENIELEKRIALTQGGDFIDREIRNKLGLVKNGEVVVVLPDVEILRQLAPPEVENKDTLPDPNWKKWGKLFF